MALTASKTASCTIAPHRVWTTAFVGGNDTVCCMIAFQSVTVSARAADGMCGASAIARIRTAALRKSRKHLIGIFLSLGLHYDGKDIDQRADRAPVRCRA